MTLIESVFALAASFEQYRDCTQCGEPVGSSEFMHGDATMADDPSVPDDVPSLCLVFCCDQCMAEWANEHGVIPGWYNWKDVGQ